MIKRVFNIGIICLLLVVINSTLVTAKYKENIVEEGYTEDGIHYVVYEEIETENLVRPNIVMSKNYTFTVKYASGNIIPPSTWNTSVTENGITYSGTLYLQSYEYENFGPSKITYAHYSGVLYARI